MSAGTGDGAGKRAGERDDARDAARDDARDAARDDARDAVHDAAHACRYRAALAWSAWEDDGAWRTRRARRVPRCDECGAERPARAPRRVVAEERAAARPCPAPLPRDETRRVAAALGRARGGPARVGAAGLLGRLRREAGLAGSAAEAVLEELALAGWLALAFRVRGTTRALDAVEILDAAALREHADPGAAERRVRAVADARARLADLDHPVALEVRRLLDADDRRHALGPAVVRALAVVAAHAAAHAATGEELAARVLSARELGDSKALDRVRGSVERRLGPLERLGVREGGAVTLVGGEGALAIGPQRLDLRAVAPFLGLARESLRAVTRVELPAGGLLVVENLAVFEACCRGEAGPREPVLACWSAGYPGRGVRSLVEAALAAGSRVRCWADLDLDGVRIARLVARWAGEAFSPFRMGADEIGRAAARRPLTRRQRAALEAELSARPDAPLADSLRAIRAAGAWVEQEALLGR